MRMPQPEAMSRILEIAARTAPAAFASTLDLTFNPVMGGPACHRCRHRLRDGAGEAPEEGHEVRTLFLEYLLHAVLELRVQRPFGVGGALLFKPG